MNESDPRELSTFSYPKNKTGISDLFTKSPVPNSKKGGINSIFGQVSTPISLCYVRFLEGLDQFYGFRQISLTDPCYYKPLSTIRHERVLYLQNENRYFQMQKQTI